MSDVALGIIAAAIAGSGVWLGSILSARAATTASRKAGEHSLIDQLQEELTGYRLTADRRSTIQDERMTRLDGLVDGYRNYVHLLRAHIYSGKAPPPPTWPEDLPR
jgi:hypothetical protein